MRTNTYFGLSHLLTCEAERLQHVQFVPEVVSILIAHLKGHNSFDRNCTLVGLRDCLVNLRKALGEVLRKTILTHPTYGDAVQKQKKIF